MNKKRAMKFIQKPGVDVQEAEIHAIDLNLNGFNGATKKNFCSELFI